MSAQSREKIALAVFAALVVLSLCGLGWYLFAGHSWNVAASNIDDTFGSMDGYTAIVYAGTQQPKQKAPAQDGASGALSSKGNKAAPGVGASPGASTKEENGAGASPGASPAAPPSDSAAARADDATSESQDSPVTAPSAKQDSSDAPPSAKGGSSDTSAAAKEGAADASPPAKEGAGEEEAAGGAGHKATDPSGLQPGKAKKPPLSVDEVRASYEDKKASVLTLDTEDPQRYREGLIIKRGSHRFGVFSVMAPSTPYALKEQVDYFKKNKVDFVVALTSDKAYVKGVKGIDIVVSTQDEGLFVMGETIDGTFYVDAPEVGKVGTILISPSNVVSAKVIEEL